MQTANVICAQAFFAELARKNEAARPAAFRRNPDPSPAYDPKVSSIADDARAASARLAYVVALAGRCPAKVLSPSNRGIA